MGIFAFCQTLAGPQSYRTVGGLQNGFRELRRHPLPGRYWRSVGKTGGFAWPLAIVAVVAVIGNGFVGTRCRPRPGG